MEYFNKTCNCYFILFYSNYDYAQFASNTEEQTDMTEEEKLLLEAYTLSIEEEKIDQNLVMCLIERICASQEDGKCVIYLCIHFTFDIFPTSRFRYIGE